MSIQTPPRYDALDVTKWICSILVVVIHCKPFQPYSDLLNALTAEGLCRIAVPFFFCTSGLLLAEKPMVDRAVNKALTSNLRLYALWSIPYFLMGLLYNSLWDQLRYTIIDGGSYYHFWYLLAMLYALPLLPFLARQKSLILVLMAVPLWTLRCLQFVYRWIPLINIPWDTPVESLRDAACCAVPMMILGILCHRFRHRRSPKFWLLSTLGFAAVNLLELLALYFLTTHTGHFEFLLTTPVTVFCLVNYLSTVDFSFTDRRIPTALRQASIWIYCIHPMLLYLYGRMHGSPGIQRFVIVLFLCLISSLGYIHFNSAQKIKEGNDYERK